DRIFRRRERPYTISQMRQAIEEEWRVLQQADIARIIATMPDRIQAVIAAKGGSTHY
ncbi:MAG: hypothetical protein M1823_003470, partial [Watsoniomyces obsoletus]